MNLGCVFKVDVLGHPNATDDNIKKEESKSLNLLVPKFAWWQCLLLRWKTLIEIITGDIEGSKLVMFSQCTHLLSQWNCHLCSWKHESGTQWRVWSQRNQCGSREHISPLMYMVLKPRGYRSSPSRKHRQRRRLWMRLVMLWCLKGKRKEREREEPWENTATEVGDKSETVGTLRGEL